MSYTALKDLVHKYGDGSADVTVTPHTFRRSFTTEMIRGEVNLYHVKDMLGHENLQTLKDYTKLTVGDLKKTHNKFHPREKGKE